MNLSERLRVDKELFSEDTMNLSERLRVDKELFSFELRMKIYIKKLL